MKPNRGKLLVKRCFQRYRLFWLILFLGITSSTNGQVYFYKQEKVVNVNTRISSKGDLSGQFVTFTNKGCYDSDKEGYSVNNGFLSYVFENDKFATYQGESYWGTAQYRVSFDKSRINVVLPDKILVYVRTRHPSDQQTSSLIKQRKNNDNKAIIFPDFVKPDDQEDNKGVNSLRYTSRYKELEQQLISAFKTYEVSLDGVYDSSRQQAAMAIHGMQRNMADWRRQASQVGVNIPVSPWETAQPSIGTIHYEKKKSY